MVDGVVASEVLWVWSGGSAGFEPGSFFRWLVGAMLKADESNFGRLESVFPEHGLCVRVLRESRGGELGLREAARGVGGDPDRQFLGELGRFAERCSDGDVVEGHGLRELGLLLEEAVVRLSAVPVVDPDAVVVERGSCRECGVGIFRWVGSGVESGWMHDGEFSKTCGRTPLPVEKEVGV